MSWKTIDSGKSKLPYLEGNVGENTTIEAGDLLYIDYTNKVFKPVTNTAGSTLNIIGIAKNNVTTGAGGSGVVLYEPISQIDYVIADCQNNSAANQLNIRHPIDANNLVNNGTADTATILGVFLALKQVGATTDKKLYGRVLTIGQVTA
jgi:hypothetical protein